MRIVIAEDSVLLRAGLVRFLTEGGEDIVAAVGDAPSLVEAVERHRPDLAVVDVRMPPTHTDEGIRAAVALREIHPDLAVLILSQYVEQTYAAELLADGRGAVSIGEVAGSPSAVVAAQVRRRWHDLAEQGLLDLGEADATPVRRELDVRTLVLLGALVLAAVALQLV